MSLETAHTRDAKDGGRALEQVAHREQGELRARGVAAGVADELSILDLLAEALREAIGPLVREAVVCLLVREKGDGCQA